MNREKFFNNLETAITGTIVMRSIEEIDDSEFIFNGEPIGDVYFKTSVDTIYGEKSYDYNEPDEYEITLQEVSVKLINQFGEPYKRINERINEIMSKKLYKKL